MLAKKTSKNQITLPKEIVKSFPDAQYFDVSIMDRKIILLPVRIAPADSALGGIRDKMERLGMTEKDVAGAIAWARKKKRQAR